MAATLRTSATPTATGVSISGAGGAVVVESTATLAPVVTTSVAGGTVTAGSITIRALSNATVAGANAGVANSANAHAYSASGSLFGTGSGTRSTATDSSVVTVATAGTLSTTGALTVLAASYSAPLAESHNPATIAGGVGLGFSEASATFRGATAAALGSNVTGAATITVLTLATGRPTATARALSGGILAGVTGADADATVARPNTTTPNAAASLGTGTITATGTIQVNATLTTSATATAVGYAFSGAVAAGTSDATATVTPWVSTTIDGGSVTSTTGSITP